MKQVICLGSPHGLDATAWALAGHVQARAAREAELQVHCVAQPLDLLHQIEAGAALYILDATPDLPAGVVQPVALEALAEHWCTSTHGIGVREVLELIEALGSAAVSVHILAIGVGQGEQPVELSAEHVAEQALPAVLAWLDKVEA